MEFINYTHDGKAVIQPAALLLSKVTVGRAQDSDFDGIIDEAVKVVNNTGVMLPETGGIGTTIFYVVGGLLMAGAVVLLITKKKMSANND